MPVINSTGESAWNLNAPRTIDFPIPTREFSPRSGQHLLAARGKRARSILLFSTWYFDRKKRKGGKKKEERNKEKEENTRALISDGREEDAIA